MIKSKRLKNLELLKKKKLNKLTIEINTLNNEIIIFDQCLSMNKSNYNINFNSGQIFKPAKLSFF